LYQEIKDIWQEMVCCNSINNPIAGLIFLHALLGAYFRHKIINWGVTNKDVRIHPSWFQQSRTGKDQLSKVLSITAKKLGLKVCTYTDFTGDAPLIGSWDSEAHKYNIAHGLSKEEPIKETSKNTYTYRDPVIKGDLANYDIIIFCESKLLFQTSSDKILTTLQPALDYPGRVFKKMRQKEAIEYPTKCTLVMTSIPFDQMRDSLIDQGFFQRTSLLIRRLSIDDIKSMRNQARKLRDPKIKKKFETLLTKIVTKLEKFDTNESMIYVTQEASDALDTIQNRFIEMTRESIKGKEVENCLSFSQSAEENLLKMAAHIALLANRNKILAKDIHEAYYPAYNIIQTIFNEIEVNDNSKENKLSKKIFLNFAQEILSNTPVPKTTFRNMLMQKFNIGAPKATRYIEDLINQNYIQCVKGEKNTILLKFK